MTRVRSALALAFLLAGPVATVVGEVVPKETVDLLADPTFKDWVFHLSEKNSLSTEQDEVAVIVDGVLQVTGKGFGYFRTKEAYQDYHLVAEYKWGERTWSQRADRARDCGLLLHCHGPDGSFGGAWLSCVQTQMLEGSMGDINVLSGKTADGQTVPSAITIEVAKDEKGKLRWKPGGDAVRFPEDGKSSASIQWKDRDPDWKDVKGFRGARDVDNPVGEWNRLEVICEGGSYRVLVNGVLVNEGRGVSPAAGWIGIQNEWAECWFRRLELWPLGKFKENWEPPAASKDTGYSETGESILPRRFALSPAASAALWQIDGDYELQLVAAEPLTCDPVDVVWDEHGRMFVAEMGDYPYPPEGGPNLSRIRLLRDHDGDGRIDEAVTWADHLDHVQGLLPMRGGLLATTRTAILFLKDTDGDDRADEITPLFHSNVARQNQLQVSSPRWGSDNAIYLNNGLDGKEIYPTDRPQAKLAFSGLNLRYDPYANEMTPVTGPGQFGASFDDFGRHFFCSNRNPIMFAVMPLEAVRRSPLARITQGYEDIQAPASPVWPVALSHTTAAAHAGTHTAACGLAVYRGDAMPDLRGNIFVCDPTAQLVTRNRLVPHGASFVAERIGDRRDFLVSADEWCRPVQVRNGPDGALYICDMYRRFIDHAMYFPDEFPRTNYMRAGADHGRIWRLVKRGTTARKIEALPDEAKELVHLLESENAWQRIHAQRLLVEGNRREAIPALQELLAADRQPEASPTAKVHALWTLGALGGLELESVTGLFSDDETGVVENALLAAARFLHGGFKEEARAYQLLQIALNGSARARFLVFALWTSEDLGLWPLAWRYETFSSFPEDPWIRRALISADSQFTGSLLWQTLRVGDLCTEPSTAKVEAFRELAAAVAAEGNLEAMAGCAGEFRPEPDWVSLAIVTGFSEGLPRGPLKAHGSLGKLCAEQPVSLAPVQAVLARAVEIACNPAAPLADRLAAIPLVAELESDQSLPLVAQLIAAGQPVGIQEAACRLLAHFDRAVVAEFFFERWETLGPVPLHEAVTLLTANSATTRTLLEKMKAGEINKALMPPMQRWSFCKSGDAAIKSLAVELFGTPNADRAALIAKYEAALADYPGDAIRGRAVFEKAACATCHQLGEVGVAVGPNLSDVRIKLPQALLTDILDPNRMMEERWTAYALETRDGRTVAGLITGDDSASVTISLPGGIRETIPREQIASLKSTGQSLMPVGLENSISPNEMADLLAFLKAR